MKKAKQEFKLPPEFNLPLEQAPAEPRFLNLVEMQAHKTAMLFSCRVLLDRWTGLNHHRFSGAPTRQEIETVKRLISALESFVCSDFDFTWPER